jgi:hypothetical protein
MGTPIFDEVMKARELQLSVGAALERDRILKVIESFKGKAKVVDQILKAVRESK